jgi:hypothetical protein
MNPTTHPNWANDHFILLIGYTGDSFIFNSPEKRQMRSFRNFRDATLGYPLSRAFLQNQANHTHKTTIVTIAR